MVIIHYGLLALLFISSEKYCYLTKRSAFVLVEYTWSSATSSLHSTFVFR